MAAWSDGVAVRRSSGDQPGAWVTSIDCGVSGGWGGQSLPGKAWGGSGGLEEAGPSQGHPPPSRLSQGRSPQSGRAR